MQQSRTQDLSLESMQSFSRYLPKEYPCKDFLYVRSETNDEPRLFADAVYPDTKSGFYLVHLEPTLPGLKPKLIPLARIGVDFDFPFLKIDQIQGARGARRHLPSSWETDLVMAMVNFSQDNGFTQVGIIKPEEIVYFYHPLFLRGSDTREKHKSRLRRRYDETSRKLGFNLGKRVGYWVLDI